MNTPFIKRYFQRADEIKPEYVPLQEYDEQTQTRWSAQEIFLGLTRDSGEQSGTKPSTESGDALD